jgi:hypothetical protein
MIARSEVEVAGRGIGIADASPSGSDLAIFSGRCGLGGAATGRSGPERVARTRLSTEVLMGIGGSIFLIAVGLILALATDFRVAGIDIQLIGWILTAVGILGLVMSFAVFGPRRRRMTVTDRVDGATPGVDAYGRPVGGPVVRERTYDDGPD